MADMKSVIISWSQNTFLFASLWWLIVQCSTFKVFYSLWTVDTKSTFSNLAGQIVFLSEKHFLLKCHWSEWGIKNKQTLTLSDVHASYKLIRQWRHLWYIHTPLAKTTLGFAPRDVKEATRVHLVHIYNTHKHYMTCNVCVSRAALILLQTYICYIKYCLLYMYLHQLALNSSDPWLSELSGDKSPGCPCILSVSNQAACVHWSFTYSAVFLQSADTWVGLPSWFWRTTFFRQILQRVVAKP